ncbi:adenine nucleotide alpha hydrolases-like protein [Backusella circina FSU 941]|nr:adenine nucleotide alpha hydrolases-like protein [Backusella circina FSU 941]
MSENTLAPPQNDKYVRGVSFDTMTDQDQPDYSFTLRGKIQGYQRTRRSRTFLVATDLANYSDYALNWAIEELMDDGDEIVVLRVLTLDLNDGRPNLRAMLRHEELQSKERASAVMSKIMAAGGPEKKISAVIEFVIGKVQETIQNMISVYQPSMLIVGTRGMSELKGMFINSVSKYCLQHSPVPVVVVRPEDKIKKQQKDEKLKKPKSKKGSRLSGMFRISSHSSLSSLQSKGSDSSESSEDEDRDVSNAEQKMKRLSVFEKIGRRSRSPSPSKPIINKQ